MFGSKFGMFCFLFFFIIKKKVAHPDVTVQYGELMLRTANLMVGSPTVFADAAVEAHLRRVAAAGVYVAATHRNNFI